MAKSNATQKVADIAESSVRGDPKSSQSALLRALGDVKFEVLHNQVLVAGYIEPAKTSGGIILTDKQRDEDIYQGSVGMVIGMGPGAFKDDRVAQFHGVTLKLHDWVLYRPSDGLGMYVNQVPCRLFQDTNILMRIQNPDNFWS